MSASLKQPCSPARTRRRPPWLRQPADRHASASSRIKPDRCRSWASPTRTSPRWWSTTSTPKAGSSVTRSSCSSRTARRRTRQPKRRRRKLVEQEHVDVVLGGIYSSTRQAIKGPTVEQGNTLYIYPEQYEGQECHPLIFCTGPVPAQQVEPLFPWLMRHTGAKTFYMPSADYIWPHTMNKKVREVVSAEGGSVVGEEYFPMDHMDYEGVVNDIMASGADVVFNTIVPPGLTPFLELLVRTPASRSGEDRSSARTSTRTSSTSCRPNTSRGSTGASTSTEPSAIRSARRCWRSTTSAIPAARCSLPAVHARACIEA